METISDLDEYSAEVQKVQLETDSLNYPTHWRRDAGSLHSKPILHSLYHAINVFSWITPINIHMFHNFSVCVFFFFNYLMASENAQNPWLKGINGTK